MTYSPDLAGLRAAYERASSRMQYRVTVSPGALGELLKERDRLADRVTALEELATFVANPIPRSPTNSKARLGVPRAASDPVRSEQPSLRAHRSGRHRCGMDGISKVVDPLG